LSVKILTVVGARPQFVKASAVSRALRAEGIEEVLVHTGQHFDDEMSAVFFRELALDTPRYNLGISGGSHGQMTGRMLERVEQVISGERPRAVLVYGDTNSTLAGALAAAKLQVPVVHVEAGLRSYRRGMPEEINRVIADQVATLLCCPTRTAVDNLRREGFEHVLNDGALAGGDTSEIDTGRPCVANVGDVMVDVLRHYRDAAAEHSQILERLKLQPGAYAVLTIHRAENTETIDAIRPILRAVSALPIRPIVFAIHPRADQLLRDAGEFESLTRNLMVVKPLSYLDFMHLQASARIILTDSGGIQKEAFCLRVPCLTLRDETEWPETTAGGWNQLVGSRPSDLRQRLDRSPAETNDGCVFGAGDAAIRTVRLLRSVFS